MRKLAFFSGRGDVLEKPSLPESTIQGRVVVSDSVAGARGPVGIRRPSGDSRLGSRLRRAITSPTIPTNASGILAQIALVIWTATVYRNSPLSGHRLWNIQAANGKVILAMAIRASISDASCTRLAARNQMRPIKRRMSKMTSINPRPPLG